MSDVRQLFPSGTPVDARGALVLGGCSVLDLAAEFGTPTLLADETALRAQAQRCASGLAERWPDSRVAWTSKSFPCTAVDRCLAEEGCGVDVAGGGELALALGPGVDPATIVLHGNAKTES